MKREDNFIFSIFWAGTCSGGGEWIFRERKCNFSLDFPAFGPSVHVGLRSKVVLRSKGYAWASVLWSFDKLREVGVFSYSVIFGFKSLVNGLVDLRP